MTAKQLLDYAVSLIEKTGKDTPVYIPVLITESTLFAEEFDHPTAALRHAIRHRSRHGDTTNAMLAAIDREHDVLRDLADRYVAENTPAEEVEERVIDLEDLLD